MQTAGFYALTLVSRRREYDDVHSFEFQPEAPIAFRAGQYVHLLAPQSPPGRENVRHLSIATSPSEATLRFTVDLGSQTVYKQKLGDLQPGGKAHLFKVKGEFVLDPADPAPVVFLAGGLGITPIRSLLKERLDQAHPGPWRLIHVARGAHLYAEEVGAWGGDQVRIARPGVAAALAEAHRDLPGARWFVAGSGRFVQGMKDALLAQGVAVDHLVEEDFS